MTTPLHTTSPWRFQDNTAWWKTNPYSVTTHAKGVHGTTLANIPNRKTVSDEQQRANAMLIASAPDLLNALQAAVEWGAPFLDAPRDARPEWFSMALAAIKKTKGQKP